ncbi:MAG TPA: DUF1565 domain-containing protein [Cyclobacteriaceae bacterium]|nr:DUF1565 domain-containing protein [Cyclobacteriaceae bacterium]
MKKIKLILMYFVVALIFFQCQDTDLVAPQQIVPEELVIGTSYQTGSTYYVSTSGNNASNGSSASPWRTLKYAITKVAANAGHTIKLAAGTYVEDGRVDVPTGVNIEGAGRDQTIIKAASSFYYNPASPAYATDKFLISLNSGSYTAGRQVLKNFTIDGDGKKLHGGIYVHYRNNVNIENVKVQYTNFSGIWLWDMKDGGLKSVATYNCSWGSSGWSAGAINVGNLERIEFDQVDINEGTGYGIKAIGPSGFNNFKQFVIHDSRVSVNPMGLWNGGSAPNIAIELWQSSLVGCQIYNNYIDNTLSLVNSNGPAATGVQAVRVYNNTFDMETRSHGQGYAIELSIHDAEIDHNYILKGTQGIANWDNAMSNWSIHHNIFYGIQGSYPGECVRSQRSGLHNVKFYNNTIEFMGNKTANVVGVYGGSSSGVDIKNNLIINSNTGYNYYQNQLIHYENGANINGLQVGSNLLNNLPLGGLLGSILNNLLSDPKIAKSGIRPTPYYVPSSGSPLIDAGVNVGLPFAGSRPDIGAYETGMSSAPPASTPPASTPPPTTPATPTTPPGSSFSEVNLDASQAALTGKMVLGNDASAGSYFGIPSGNGANYYIPAPASATYNFQASAAGTYTLWVRVKAANSDSRGYYIYDGKGHWTTWKAGSRPTWTWVKVTDANSGAVVNFSLQQGSNMVQFGWLHDNVQVDKIVFTNNPNYTPSN